MAALIRVHAHLLPPLRFQTQPSPHYPPKLRLSCSNSNSDMELVMDLETEIEKMKTQMVRTHDAMKTSRKLLCEELCLYLGLGKEELRRRWERMGEDDKWVVADEFVSDWGSNFHPLSARSVKELVDQHLFHDDDDAQDDSSSFHLFSGLKKLLGFPNGK